MPTPSYTRPKLLITTEELKRLAHAAYLYYDALQAHEGFLPPSEVKLRQKAREIEASFIAEIVVSDEA